MEKDMTELVDEVQLSEEEVQEQFRKALGDFDVQGFLVDIMIFDYLIKNSGVVTITEEDIQKIEEIKNTRSIEFMSDLDKDGKRVMIARLIYEGKEKTNEESDNDN